MALSKGNVAVGIDLGTTYSCVAVYRNGKVEAIASTKTGAYITPSWVTYTNDQVLVGQIAKDYAYRNLHGSVNGIKRVIGRKYDDPVVQKAAECWKFDIKDDSGVLKLEVFHKNKNILVYPEEISALILKEMKENAEAYLEEKNITDVVITVPAYFNDHQRQATIDAAKIAGLNVLRLINEPTAAAIAYIYDKPEKNNRNICVYDLGGGTFDVSIINLEGSNIKVKATGGDTNLGGVNFDERCMSYLLKLFEKVHGFRVDKAANLKFLYRLREQVEKAKQDLSCVLTTKIDIPAVDNNEDLWEDFGRPRFDDINEELYNITFQIVEQCLTEANLKKEDIDDILLVGGSTRIIRIEEELQRIFDKPISKAVNRDQAVAHGAAILAAKFNATLPVDLNILDVTTMSLGIETRDGQMSFLIKRNTQIPFKAHAVYTTAPDGENAIRMTILEGDNKKASENLELGVFDLLDLPEDPSVHVTFNIDINGILTVKAEETSSGINNTMNIELNKGRLNEKEILKLQRHSAAINESNLDANTVKDKKSTFEAYLLKVKQDVKKDKEKVNTKDVEILLNVIEGVLKWLTTPDANDLRKLDKKVSYISKYCSTILEK